MKKIFCIMLVLVALVGCLAGCSEAEKVNYNMTQQAQYFGVERKITVYNALTDKVIMEAEGFMDISNNSANELVVTCKVGPNEYKKNYVFLNAFTLYAVEDITGTHTDPYHYKMIFHTELPLEWEARP